MDDDGVSNVLVWFEDNPAGRTALARAHEVARDRHAHLVVLTVAAHERVIGCGRCLQGTVLWNLEMKKIANEELYEAECLLERAGAYGGDVSYESVVGDPADAITQTAVRVRAETVVLPRQRRSRLTPPSRRNIGQRVGSRGSWRVIACS